jgi:hypothetical protein
MLAGEIADELEMDSQWQIMDKEKLKAGEWSVVHPADDWQPRMNETPPAQAVNAADRDPDL